MCREIAELKPAKVVYGPATFINTAVNQIQDEFVKQQQQAADAGAAGGRGGAASCRSGAATRAPSRSASRAPPPTRCRRSSSTTPCGSRSSYGISGIPQINDPAFVSTLVFDRTAGEAGVPKSRFAYLFPSKNAALIQIRLRPDLTRCRAGARDRPDPDRHRPRRSSSRKRGCALHRDRACRWSRRGSRTPIQRSIFILLGAALVLMAATLALVFRSRLRLLPLGLALAAAAMTFGALSLAGGSLTMASIAALPVLIGLAVDYAIQFQARFDEAEARGDPEPAVAAAVAGGPTILTAGLATATGFLVLLLSPVPMVRGFGLLLVLGIVLALACALCAGFAALVRFRGRASGAASPSRGAAAVRAPVAWLGARAGALRTHPRAQAAGEWLADRSWRALGLALSRPRRVLAIGLAVAVVGLALDTQSEVVSDVRELVPQDLQALRDVNVLQEETGVSGEIDVTVRADDITDPSRDRLDDALPEPGAARARLPPGQALHAEAERARAVPGAVAARPVQHGRPGPGRPRCSTPCRPTSRRAW